MTFPVRSRRNCVGMLILALLFAAASVRAQQTIHVPADQPSIQAAINAANNGDTVLVAPGTYAENINFSGKAITVTSSGGPSITTIDGGALGSVVTFNTGETSSSVLSGFTIQNGTSNFMGSGILIQNASPTISGNTITQNGGCDGLGIGVNNGSPLIQGNTITNNTRSTCSGGNGGGGISLLGGPNAQILNNTITNNTIVGGEGGGISLNGAGTPTIQGNFISGNSVSGLSPAATGGGIRMVNDSNPLVIQNIIIANNADQGAGVSVLVPYQSQGPVLVNNTILNNNARQNVGSGVLIDGFDSQSQLVNNIITGASGQNAMYCPANYPNSTPLVSFNDVFSSGTAYGGLCASQNGINNNISADPLFLSPANSDFHLQAASPAVNAGSNSASNLPSTDFDGNPRVAGTIDLGVYEVVPTSVANVSPTSLSFGPQAGGTTSSPQIVTLSSTGATPFQITSVQLPGSGAFAASTSCPTLGNPGGFAGIASGNNCTYSVTFTPFFGASPGATFGGNLTVNSTNGASLVVSLSGSVPPPPPTISLSTTSLSFASQVVGSTSSPQSVTLTNTSNFSLSIASISASTQFAESDNCAASLVGGASCTINVSFAPSVAGSASGTLTLTDNAANSPQTVSLTGTGIAPPAVSLSPSSLAFGSQVIGTTSPAQTVTLTNNGGSNLNISSFQASLPFAQTNNCPAPLAAGASCTITVTFTPQTVGNANGGVTLFDNASGSPQSVILSGTGLAPAAVSISPSSLNFSTPLGRSSAPQTLTVTNAGGGALDISSVAATLPFVVYSTNCTGPALAGGASCTITISFTPQSNATVTGTLTITDSAANSPQSVPLSGTTPANVSFSPSSLTFSSQAIGTTSAAQTATLTNTGGASMSISSVTAAQPFAQTSTCPATLAGGASCSISVTFTPQAVGTANGAVTVSDNAAGSPQSLTLTGTTPAIALVAPSNLIFPAQLIGSTGATQTITLTNTGGASITVTSLSYPNAFSVPSTNCFATPIVSGASCTISVAFSPTVRGLVNGTLQIFDSASGSPQSVPLSGTGLAPAAVSFNVPSVSFAPQIVGTTTAATQVNLSNTGDISLNISNISTVAPFAETNNCPTTLAGGANCVINLNFTPQVSGPQSGALTVTDTAAGSPHALPLNGTGVDFTIAANPASLSVSAGSSVNTSVSVNAAGSSFNQSVSLSCSGLPAASTCAFSPSAVTPGNGGVSSTLKIQTTRRHGNTGTPAGTFTITITGLSGNLVHHSPVTLTVN